MYAIASSKGNLLASVPRYEKISVASHPFQPLGASMYAIASSKGNLLASVPRYVRR